MGRINVALPPVAAKPFAGAQVAAQARAHVKDDTIR